MDVKLSPEIELKVNERVGGPYGSPSDVVEEALKAFFGPENMTPAEIEDLNRAIDIGVAEARRGAFIEGDQACEMTLQRLKSRHRA